MLYFYSTKIFFLYPTFVCDDFLLKNPKAAETMNTGRYVAEMEEDGVDAGC